MKEARKMKKLIKVDIKTHTRLESLGAKSDTFDDIIKRLIDIQGGKNG